MPAPAPVLELRVAEREVLVAGSPVEFTRREFDLLAYLVARPRRVVRREELLVEVWASSSEWQDPATVTEHVRRVRRKIAVAAVSAGTTASPSVATVRGVGYRFEPGGGAPTGRR
ncbi:MAG: winged helix-turn-helix domain-containing protein [Acidimicrobiales bacterium]